MDNVHSIYKLDFEAQVIFVNTKFQGVPFDTKTI